MSTTKQTISTKPEAGKEAQQTVLTIDWTDCTPEVLQAFATQSLIVRVQASYRKNGIPKEDTVKALDYAPGTRRVGGGGKFNVEKLDPKTLTPEQIKELVRKLKEAGAAV